MSIQRFYRATWRKNEHTFPNAKTLKHKIQQYSECDLSYLVIWWCNFALKFSVKAKTKLSNSINSLFCWERYIFMDWPCWFLITISNQLFPNNTDNWSHWFRVLRAAISYDVVCANISMIQTSTLKIHKPEILFSRS